MGEIQQIIGRQGNSVVRTIADTLGCSRRYVRKLCEQERVLAVHIGREWRVGVSEASKLALIRLNLRGISE